jgi:hypothetical protein
MSILSEFINTAKEIIEVARQPLRDERHVSHIPGKKVPVSYPEEPVTMFHRFRGEHFPDVNEDGGALCRLFSAWPPSRRRDLHRRREDLRPHEERGTMDHHMLRSIRLTTGVASSGDSVSTLVRPMPSGMATTPRGAHTPGEMVKDKEYLLANKAREKDLNIIPK